MLFCSIPKTMLHCVYTYAKPSTTMPTKQNPSKKAHKASEVRSATLVAPNPKKRSVVPIKSTIEAIKGYPNKLVIFKIPASPYFWVRYYDGKPIKRSTKTESKREAIKFAKDFYENLLVNNKLGISNNSRKSSFEICAEQIINEDLNKVKRKELAETYVNSQVNIINKHVMMFFKNYEIGDIDYALLDKFKTYLYEKNLSAGTIKINFVCLKKIFGYAQRNGLIATSPLLPKVKNEDNARGYFTTAEYLRLRRTAKKLNGMVSEVIQTVGEGDDAVSKKLRNIEITEEIQHLIPFMVFSFIRPTDLKNIKHKHIEIKNGEGGDYLFMPIPTSKRHNKPITAMPRATKHYKALRDMRIKELSENGKQGAKIDISNEYLFMPQYQNRNYAYAKIARQFEVLLNVAGLKISPNDDVRTLYSLRHTSLMYRLKYGAEINPLKLANNARTSVEMLERFYLAQLESSEYTKDLHAKKQPRIRKKPSAIKVTQPKTNEEMAKELLITRMGIARVDEDGIIRLNTE
jgi:Phage integrase SAM-like domain